MVLPLDVPTFMYLLPRPLCLLASYCSLIHWYTCNHSSHWHHRHVVSCTSVSSVACTHAHGPPGLWQPDPHLFQVLATMGLRTLTTGGPVPIARVTLQSSVFICVPYRYAEKPLSLKGALVLTLDAFNTPMWELRRS